MPTADALTWIASAFGWLRQAALWETAGHRDLAETCRARAAERFRWAADLS